jgi:hypothetical protein
MAKMIKRFSMMEIILALAIVIIAMVGVMGLLPNNNDEFKPAPAIEFEHMKEPIVLQCRHDCENCSRIVELTP